MLIRQHRKEIKHEPCCEIPLPNLPFIINKLSFLVKSCAQIHSNIDSKAEVYEQIGHLLCLWNLLEKADHYWYVDGWNYKNDVDDEMVPNLLVERIWNNHCGRLDFQLVLKLYFIVIFGVFGRHGVEDPKIIFFDESSWVYLVFLVKELVQNCIGTSYLFKYFLPQIQIPLLLLLWCQLFKVYLEMWVAELTTLSVGVIFPCELLFISIFHIDNLSFVAFKIVLDIMFRVFSLGGQTNFFVLLLLPFELQTYTIKNLKLLFNNLLLLWSRLRRR